VVGRVSDRVARGLTLALALAAEEQDKINVETWKKALQAHPEFSPRYEAGKGKFLEWATQRLAESKDLANLRWLLERRHAGLFARPDLQLELRGSASVNVSIPEPVLQRALEIAHAESRSERVAIKKKDH